MKTQLRKQYKRILVAVLLSCLCLFQIGTGAFADVFALDVLDGASEAQETQSDEALAGETQDGDGTEPQADGAVGDEAEMPADGAIGDEAEMPAGDADAAGDGAEMAADGAIDGEAGMLADGTAGEETAGPADEPAAITREIPEAARSQVEALKARIDNLPPPDKNERLTNKEMTEIVNVDNTLTNLINGMNANIIEDSEKWHAADILGAYNDAKLTVLKLHREAQKKLTDLDMHLTLAKYTTQMQSVIEARAAYEAFVTMETSPVLWPDGPVDLGQCKGVSDFYAKLQTMEKECEIVSDPAVKAYLEQVNALQGDDWTAWAKTCDECWAAVEAAFAGAPDSLEIPILLEAKAQHSTTSAIAFKRLLAGVQDGILDLNGATYTLEDKITISSDLTIQNGTIRRASNYLGKLLVVDNSATLTLTNVTIDGSSIKGCDVLVEVSKATKPAPNSKLILQTGAVLQNNYGKVANVDVSNGGAIRCYGDLLMYDGSLIQGCKSGNGGGVLVSGQANSYTASFEMYGGTIQNCSASFDHLTQYNTGSGGGVLVNGAARFTMYGGTIQGNTAGYGGGVAAGRFNAFTSFGDVDTQFIMNGGTIDGNEAGGNGGGIFINFKGYTGVINAGNITNNKCATKPYPNNMTYYGGGGIYVNGNTAGTTGKLRVYNAEITGNQAAYEGGGLAGCPYSQVAVYMTDGGLIYGNTAGGAFVGAGGAQQQIFVTSSRFNDNGNPMVYISPVMLGGARYNWTDASGKTIPDEELTVALGLQRKEIAAYNALTAFSESVQQGKPEVKTIISGNVSNAAGGGIGTNGAVEIGTGTEQDATVSIWIQKQWKDDGSVASRPKSIRFWLRRNGERVGSILMEAGPLGTWPETSQELFKGLRKYDLDGKPYVYTVEEEYTGLYTVEVAPGDTDSQENPWIFTNTPKTDSEFTTITVNKAWVNNDGTTDAPDGASITVKLTRNGEATAQAAVLSAENGWSYTFEDLPVNDQEGTRYVYGIVETAYAGYTASYSDIVEGAMTITNRQVPPGTPPPYTPPYTPPGGPNPPDEPAPPDEPLPPEEPPIDIEEPDVPLADLPDEDVPLADIPDEDVPLANAPKTNDESQLGLWLALQLCSYLGLILCAKAFLWGKPRKKRG